MSSNTTAAASSSASGSPTPSGSASGNSSSPSGLPLTITPWSSHARQCEPIGFNFTGSVPPLSFNLLDAHYRLVDFVSNSSTQTSGTSSLLMRIGQGGRAVYLEVVDAWGAQETSTPLTVSGGSFECMRPPQSHRVRSSTTPVIAGAVSAVVGVIAVVGAALLFHRVYSRRRAKLEKERDEPAPPYDDVGLPPPYKASN